jgi:hypothetical protein
MELRLVVWDTKDVIKADWEGTTDIFVRAFFDSKKDSHETDTHFRCQTGKGSFNYRLLFPITSPMPHSNLSVQIWDRDIFSSNEYLGDTSMNLKLPIEDCADSMKTINLNKSYYNSYLKHHMGNQTLDFYDDDSFWLDCNRKEKDG